MILLLCLFVLAASVSGFFMPLQNPDGGVKVNNLLDHIIFLEQSIEINMPSDIADLKTQLNAVVTKLTEVETELGVTKTDLATTKTDLATAKTDLSLVESKLEASQRELMELQQLNHNVTDIGLKVTKGNNDCLGYLGS